MYFLRRCLALSAQKQRILKNIQKALSPEFVDKWGTAIDQENESFHRHQRFSAVPLPAGARPLPGLCIFTRKLDGSAKACFCVGSHRQIMGRDYFPNKNYCAFLSCRDNRLITYYLITYYLITYYLITYFPSIP
jgi:hypothetical protein